MGEVLAARWRPRNAFLAPQGAPRAHFSESYKKIMKDLTVENLFNLAASQGLGAGVTLSQLETRIKMEKEMGKKLVEDFKSIEVDNSKKLWTSCFYLVVK